MRTFSQNDIDHLLMEAQASPRRRAIYRFHEHHEPVQRMINAILPGSYVQPHKHEDPDKVELFSILRGRLAVLRFNDLGSVTQVIFLDAAGPINVIDIPPRVYHCLIALEPSASLEIIQGPYEAATHKKPAPWAPDEANPKAGAYLMYLVSIVENWQRA